MKQTFIAFTALLALSTLSALADPEAKDMKGIASPEMRPPSDAGFYVSAFGGANVAQNYGNSRTEFTQSGSHFVFRGDSENHVGGVGGLKAGYDFESQPVGGNFGVQFAVETEAYYLGTKTDVHSRFSPGDNFDLRGNMNDGAFMLNGLVRLKTGTLFTPYIGAGIGTEYLTFTRPVINEEGFGDESVHHNSNAFAGAVQVIGGFDFEIAKHWDLFTEYKYLVAIDPSLDFGNADISGPFNLKFDPYELGQHLVTAGIKYKF